MIIKETNCNLITSFLNNELDLLVHGCNCFNTMGAGIAKEIKSKIPQAYKADLRTNKGDKSKLVNYSIAITDNGIIINAYTQYYYGKPKKDQECLLDYEALKQVFININKDYPNTTVGIPTIGCGLAGGNWNKVKDIINEVTPDINVVVFYYKA